MPMTGTYRVQDIGNSVTDGRTKTNKKKLSGSVEELYNEIENQSQLVSKRKSF
jgi:hypothetical protein